VWVCEYPGFQTTPYARLILYCGSQRCKLLDALLGNFRLLQVNRLEVFESLQIGQAGVR